MRGDTQFLHRRIVAMTGWTSWAKTRHLDSLEAMPACARRRFTAEILDASSSNVAQIPEIQVFSRSRRAACCVLRRCVTRTYLPVPAVLRVPVPAVLRAACCGGV